MVGTSAKIGKFKWKTPVEQSVGWNVENLQSAGSLDVKWRSVSLSEVASRDHRLEAGVFDVEAKRARNLIIGCKFGCVSLMGQNGLVNHAYYPGRFKRIYTDTLHGEPFYLPSQMTDIYPHPEKFISAITQCPIDELRLKENSLLLTRSGTIGTVSCVSKTLAGKVFSDDVIRISFKNAMDLGYVYTYLRSKIGNTILKTNGYGSVITHLEPEHLEEIPIPDAPAPLKAEIHERIRRSYELRDESNALLDEATALLTEALHLPPLHQFKVVSDENRQIETFSVKLSNLDGRADASYHISLAGAIVEHLQEHAAEVTTIGDPRISRDVILPGRFKRVYVEEEHGRVFIGGKQIGELDPSNKKYLSPAHHGDRIESQLGIHENMTLITRSGTIGKVALVPKHWEKWIASEHIIRVVPASPNIAGYLYIFLASNYAHPLITRFTYGSVVDEIDDNHVRQIPIPLLKSQDVQTRINDLALQANDKRYEAFLLEQEAINKMNEQVIFA